MLTEIEPCDPPEAFRGRLAGPTRPIDCEILEYLVRQSRGVPLADITQAVGSTTHNVHSRVSALVDRGLVHREVLPGGPRRGPGASLYRVTKAASWTCPS